MEIDDVMNLSHYMDKDLNFDFKDLDEIKENSLFPNEFVLIY